MLHRPRLTWPLPQTSVAWTWFATSRLVHLFDGRRAMTAPSTGERELATMIVCEPYGCATEDGDAPSVHGASREAEVLQVRRLGPLRSEWLRPDEADRARGVERPRHVHDRRAC